MSGRPLLRLRPAPRPWTELPRLVAPCFRRGREASRADTLQSQPAILSFEGTDFVNVLLRGLGQLDGRQPWPTAWPRLRAARDWCEPPRATLDANGQPRFLSNLRRRTPPPAELHPEPDGGQDLDVALAADETGPAWIRKLYLPLHSRFSVVMSELVCDGTGLPPLDRRRVIEQGLVLRRLVPDPARERWQDWISGPDQGAWVEVADTQMIKPDGQVLDPTAPKLDTSVQQRLQTRLGLDDGRALRLTVTRMTPVPPNAGSPGRRCASFGVLSLFSAEQEAPPISVMDSARLAADTLEALREALGLGGLPPEAIVWPELSIIAEDLDALRASRLALLPSLGCEPEPTAGLAELGADLEVRLGAEAARGPGAIPGWPEPVADAGWAAHLEVHRRGRLIEARISAIETALSAGGELAWQALEAREPAAPEADPLWTRIQRLPGPTRREIEAFLQGITGAIAEEGAAESCPPRPRLDPDHLYAAWCYARIRPKDACCREPLLVWSQRTEPFCIAEPLDVLGLRPAQIRLPDLARLARDLPRIPRAGAFPMAVVTTPPDSGFSTTDEAKDTAREWGIAWVCSIGIPVLTFCAWVMFSFIFKILIALPGFTWMLLLKLCVPLPVPKKEGA